MFSRLYKLISVPIKQGLIWQAVRNEYPGLERYPKLFVLPDKNREKGLGNDRHMIMQKQKSTTHVFFKKIREMYHRSMMQPKRGLIYAKRLRVGDESCVDLNRNKEVAAVIRGREECEEVDFVLDRRIVYMLKKAESPHARQYLIKFPEGKEEEIIVTLQSITFHDRKIDGA